jgi:YD repeat-containing protein
LHTVQYTYDGLSCLIAADYFTGQNVDGDPFREYDFAYDLSGNRSQQVVEIAGSPTTTDYTYDAANRLTAVDAQSITYNNAGQLTDDGTMS